MSLSKLLKCFKEFGCWGDKVSEHVDIYTLNAVRGFKAETWGPREGSQNPGTKAAFEAQWVPAPNGGLQHVSGLDPDLTVLETDTRFSPLERGNDDHKLTYCIDNREGTADLAIIDTDARAESLRVYLGCADCMQMTYERYQANDAGQNQTPFTSQGQPVAVVPMGEIKIMCVYIHDPGPDFSGFFPVANYVGVEDTVDFISYQDKPTVTCRTVERKLCDPMPVLLENESFKPIDVSCHCTGAGGGVPDDWRCEEVCAVVGYVTVSAAGDVVQSCGGAVVNKTGTGSYNITAPAGAVTSNAWAIVGEPQNNNTNDVRAHFSSSFTTGDFHIEQQSGNGQWQDVDKPFTIHWYGMRQQVVC